MKNFRAVLISALLLLVAAGFSIDVLFFGGLDQRYQVLGTVPYSMERHFAGDQAIIFYLNRPLPADQVLASPFTGVVYRKAGDPADGTAATGTATILPGRKAIVFVASPPLKAGAFDPLNYNYELSISHATSGLRVIPYTISFSTDSDFDEAGIWVQQASPVADAISVSTDYHPFLIMNEPMDPATVQASNVLLSDVAGHVTATTVSFDYSNNALSIAPSTTLQPSTVYVITVSFGLKSMGGKSLRYPYVWRFTTRAAPTPPDLTSPKPYIVKVEPIAYSTEVALNSPMTVFFSQPMDPSTLTTQTVHLRAYGQWTDLPVTLTYSSAEKSLTIQPTSALPGSTAISFILDAENILSASKNTSDLQPKVNTSTILHTSPPVETRPPPPQPPSSVSPQLKDYLLAHDQLIRDEVAFMNQHQSDDPEVRQKALKQWQQQNAPRFQQLQLQSHALRQNASKPTSVPTPDNTSPTTTK